MHVSPNSKQAPSLTSRKPVLAQNDPREMLELLLALDRSVVEVSMQLYNVDRGDRRRMRAQNRRLHAAVRDEFPRLMKVARNKAA